MRSLAIAALTVVLIAAGQDQKWHRTLEAGKKASARSGKPVFLLTIWALRV